MWETLQHHVSAIHTKNFLVTSSAEPIHFSGNHDASWTLAAMFGVPAFPGLFDLNWS
jgi:hypothetical protein